MKAVEAFSQNEITPIEKTAVPEISEDTDMEDEESLFDDGEQLPFENYFNVNREDVHNDKSQTISLIPPEDNEDEEPKWRHSDIKNVDYRYVQDFFRHIKEATE